MTIRFNASIGALVCCLAAAPAMAVTTDEDEINSYVSLNGGVTKAQHACNNNYWLAPGQPCSENYSGYRLAYGYQFTPAWGIELSYGDFGYSESKGIGALIVGPAVYMGDYTWSLKANGWAAFATGTAVYGVPTAGGASTHFAYGGGAQVNFTPNFGIRAQYEYFGKYDVFNIYGIYGVVSPKVGLSMGSLGLVYRF